MPSDPPDRRVVDFAPMRVTMLADTLRDLVDQIKLTNTHVGRLGREIVELRGEMIRSAAELRDELRRFEAATKRRFDRLEHDLGELRSEQVLPANQIPTAQQDARSALLRIEALLEASADSNRNS